MAKEIDTMHVSLKRWIALVAWLAIAWAGTPTAAVANDGLNPVRYGIGSEKPALQVARQTPANLNQNPFRNKTVTAQLSGNSIRIDAATVTQSNVAILLTGDTANQTAVAFTPAKVEKSTCRIHTPVFETPLVAAAKTGRRSFFSGLLDIGGAAAGAGKSLFDSSLEQLQIVGTAEREFHRTVTALASGYPVATSSKITQTLAHTALPGSHANTPALPELACHPANRLIRRTSPNIAILMMDVTVDEPFEPGQQLLIEEYLPLEQSRKTGQISAKPRSLAVPAMSISYRSETASASPDAPSSVTATAVIRSAKAVIKSLLQVVEPVLGIPQSMSIQQRIRGQWLRIDELIWSASSLRHVESLWTIRY
jgi:hypothetical protein